MVRSIPILAVLVAVGFSSAAFGQQTRPATRPTDGPVAVVALHGTINNYSKDTFIRHFEQAREAGAKTVIIDLDTYGGLVQSGLELSHFIKNQTDVHTVVYVREKAISAGAMVALAANEIVMNDFARIGDAAPIAIGPGGTLQPLPAAERAKSESPVLADFIDSAQTNGYSEHLAAAMVSVGRSVYWIEHVETAQRRFVDGEKYKELIESKQWKLVEDEGIPNPVDGADTLLTLSGRQAAMVGLAQSISPTLAAFTAERGYDVVARFERDFNQKVIGFLSDDMVRGLLMTVFLVSLYISMQSPGQGFPEVVAMVALGTLLGVPLLTGHAQWWEIVAILLGIVLLAVELFVIPGFGVAGLAGIVLILSGLLFTFVAPEPGRSPFSLPTLPLTWTALREGLTVLVASLVISLALAFWLRRYLPKLPYFNALILNTTVGSSEGARVGSLSNIDPSEEVPGVGAAGEAVTDLRPGGTARFMDAAGQSHLVSVVSDSGFALKGASLVVREVAGNRIVVRAAPHRQEKTT
jgi:membrane-bound serine protease (ClpP class)